MRKTIVVCSLLALAMPASAEIFRCMAPGGSVSYQEQPCEPGAHGGAVAIPTTFPDHVTARERLAAREAALDARLLKRLEIEAAERIARDERIARESELQAERERASAVQAWMPVFIGSPVRVHPSLNRRPVAPVTPRHSLPLMR